MKRVWENEMEHKPPEDSFDHNLIPSEKLSLLKIKVGKNHRKESDWDVIKDILSSYRIITIEPATKVIGFRVIEHVLCRGNTLFVFTNVEDCQEYIKSVARDAGGTGIYFSMGSIGLNDVIDIAHREHMDIYIDANGDKNRKFIRYSWSNETLAVSMLG